eukprot:scaffold70295_cov20-Prasinocladus_malaysianus.AAC.1
MPHMNTLCGKMRRHCSLCASEIGSCLNERTSETSSASIGSVSERHKHFSPLDQSILVLSCAINPMEIYFHDYIALTICLTGLFRNEKVSGKLALLAKITATLIASRGPS